MRTGSGMDTRPVRASDRSWVESLVSEHFASPRIVSRGVVHDSLILNHQLDLRIRMAGKMKTQVRTIRAQHLVRGDKRLTRGHRYAAEKWSMMNKLVFIGGAPGVGKSTVVTELFAQIDRSVWLDGDDVWRMHPFMVNDATMQMVERNIQFVLRSFLKTGFSCILFTWVLHQDSIVKRLLQGLEDQQF